MPAHSPDPSGLDGIHADAASPDKTPFDYIVVGSGAGGGPLAARLARAGMKVLVLEAGVDPGAPPPKPGTDLPGQRASENEHLLYHCPGLHAASTEPHQYTKNSAAHTSLGFDVRHTTDPAGSTHYYPRAQALGGCTAHHAMITIDGGRYDWTEIARLTGDCSWAPAKMRAIYQRIERSNNGVVAGRLSFYFHWFLNWLNPGRDAAALRGDQGWLDVTLTDPHLAMSDRRLMKVILKTAIQEEGLTNARVLWRWIKRVASGMLFRDLDLNDERTLRENPEGVALVPLGVTRGGLRRGPRELLLETRQVLLRDTDRFAGRLHIATGVFVKRVIFDDSGDVPRAVGVQYDRGRHLYNASPEFDPHAPREQGMCFARREIILSGGAFQSPQILMLSGIGDQGRLNSVGVKGIQVIKKVDDHWKVHERQGLVHLPGVGQNLLDRCELSVITEMKKPFRSLNGVEFDPNQNDPQLDAWKAEGTNKPRTGIYTTNGAVLAILRRSCSASPPDLLMFGFPMAFRGYERGWSKQLLARTPGDTQQNRSLWSWVILRARSKNPGELTLRSNNPAEAPDINFRYFGNAGLNPGQVDPNHPDMKALVFAIRYIRRLNYKSAKLVKGGDPAAAEVQPGKDLPDGSPALRDWIVKQTWGHHACGTCRIGSDPWRSNTGAIRDKSAVLDSKFRVHGVRGLRVVDASVFPTIPGYFIAVPTYMIGEKAADTILYELSH